MARTIVAAKLERLRTGNERTRELVRRSHDSLVISEKLLKTEVPKIRHPKALTWPGS
jgi:hypothetical protein